MEIEDFWAWDFEPELTKDSEILCPECKGWSHCFAWEETEVACELCGTHSAIECPNCGEQFDHVWCDSFKTRIGVAKNQNNDAEVE